MTNGSGGAGSPIKEAFRDAILALVGLGSAVGILYFVSKELDHIFGGTASDRDIVVTVEFAVLIIVFGFVGQRHALHMIAHLFQVFRKEKSEEKSDVGPITIIFVAAVVSLLIYFAFVKFVLPYKSAQIEQPGPVHVVPKKK